MTPGSRAKAVETAHARGSFTHLGETNPNSKITDAERDIIVTSSESAKNLAERYGVSRTRIYQLRKNYSK